MSATGEKLATNQVREVTMETERGNRFAHAFHVVPDNLAPHTGIISVASLAERQQSVTFTKEDGVIQLTNGSQLEFAKRNGIYELDVMLSKEGRSARQVVEADGSAGKADGSAGHGEEMGADGLDQPTTHKYR